MTGFQVPIFGWDNGAECECLCKVGDIWEAIKESWEQEYSVSIPVLLS